MTIDTRPDALERLADELMRSSLDGSVRYVVPAFVTLRAVAAEKRRDEELVRELVEALERILNPSPGVAKLPPWVYGIAGAAIAKARAQGKKP